MDKKYIAIIGAALLIVGLFLPAITSPAQSSSFLIPAEDEQLMIALGVMACGLLGAALAFMGKTKFVVFPGIIALGVIVWRYFDVQARMGRVAEMLATSDNVPPDFAAMLTARMPHINFLGWGVMGAGALIMVVAGAMAWKSAPPPAA